MEPWPPPPFVDSYLLENPAMPCLFFLAIAAIFAAIGYKRAQRKPMLIAGAMLVPVIVLVVIAAAVETERERMVARTRALVAAAVSPPDIQKFEEILAPNATLDNRNRQQLLSSIEAGLNRWKIRGAFITRLEVHQSDENRGKTYMSVLTRVDTSVGGGSTQSRWMLHWLKMSDGIWRIDRIEWLSINDRPARSSDLP